MATQLNAISCSALVQQGYDYSPDELKQLSWGLRFTPGACMAGAVVGLILQEPRIHFAMAALGILPFWFPAWHPVDRFYNHVLVPLWKGVRLPPNPLPRRIACVIGGSFNLLIAISFVAGSPVAAYVFGAILLTLQFVMIATHFCLASWFYEIALLLTGRREPPIAVDEARDLIAQGAELIDVREPYHFTQEHLPDARNIPLALLADQIGAAPDLSNIKTYLFYCQSGIQSQRAVQLLKRRGFEHIHNLGGIKRMQNA